MGGAPASNWGITGRLRNHHAADSRAASAGDWVSYEEIRLGKGYATEAAKACLAWGMQQTDFPAFYCYQKSTNLPSRRVSEKLGMTLQEIYADPVNTFTSVYAITRAEFFAKSTKRPAIINISAESLFRMGMQQTDFPAFYCYQKARTCPHGEFRETGNDLAGNRYRPLCMHSLACMQLQE